MHGRYDAYDQEVSHAGLMLSTAKAHERLLQSNCYHAFMEAHIRISVKKLLRNKNLKTRLARVPFARHRQFWVKTNGQSWPKDGRPVSLTRLFTTLQKSLDWNGAAQRHFLLAAPWSFYRTGCRVAGECDNVYYKPIVWRWGKTAALIETLLPAVAAVAIR